MTFLALQQRHEALLARQSALDAADIRRRAPAAGQLARDVEQFMADVVAGSEQVTDPRERDLLRAYLRYWATFTYDWSGLFPKTDLRPADMTATEPAGVRDTGAPAPTRGGLPRWTWLLGLLGLLLPAAVALTFLWSRSDSAQTETDPSPPPVTPLPPVTRTRVPDVEAPGETIDRDNASKLQEIGRVDAHTNGALDVAFDPDRPELVTAGVDGVVRFWVVPTLALSRQLNDQPGWVRAVAYSPYGEGGRSVVWPLIVTGGNDRALRTYDLESLQLFAEFRPTSENSGFVFATAFSPDGRLIASGHGDGVARIWDVGSGTESMSVPAGVISSRLAQIPSGATAVNDVAFRPDDGNDDDGNDNANTGGPGLNLALALNGSVGVQVMDGAFTEPICALQTGSTAAVTYSPGGEWLAVGTDRGTLLLVTAEGCRVALDVFAHEGGVTDIAFDPDGEWLVTSGRDGTLKLFSIEGRPLATLTVGVTVEAVAVEPEAGRIASVDANGQLILWGVPGDS